MLREMRFTDALLDVDSFVLSAVEVIVEHGLEIGIVALAAGALVEDSIGEESVEAEADEEGLADLVGGEGTSEFE